MTTTTDLNTQIAAAVAAALQAAGLTPAPTPATTPSAPVPAPVETPVVPPQSAPTMHYLSEAEIAAFRVLAGLQSKDVRVTAKNSEAILGTWFATKAREYRDTEVKKITLPNGKEGYEVPAFDEVCKKALIEGLSAAFPNRAWGAATRNELAAARPSSWKQYASDCRVAISRGLLKELTTKHGADLGIGQIREANRKYSEAASYAAKVDAGDPLWLAKDRLDRTIKAAHVYAQTRPEAERITANAELVRILTAACDALDALQGKGKVDPLAGQTVEHAPEQKKRGRKPKAA